MGFADGPTTYDHVFLIRDDGGYLGPEPGPETLPLEPVPSGETPLHLQTSRVFGRLRAHHKDIFDFLVVVPDDITGGHRRNTRSLHHRVQQRVPLDTRRLKGVAMLTAGCLKEQPGYGSRAVLHEFRHLEQELSPTAVTLYQAAFILLTRDPERAVKEGTADLVNECRKAFEVLIYESTRKRLLMRTNLW